MTMDCAMESRDPPVDFLFLANNSSNCPISSGSSITGTSLHTNDLPIIKLSHLLPYSRGHITHAYLLALRCVLY